MEILFVVVVIALLLSFAMPAFRSVRYDIKNARAQHALKKLAEARRSFYQYSKGVDLNYDGGENVGYFSAADAQTLATETDTYKCQNLAASGVPGGSVSKVEIRQLFLCKFLDWRDFVDLPYTFYVCNVNAAKITVPCNRLGVYAGAVGTSEAGSKYVSSAYYMYVGQDMQVHEVEL